MDLTQNDLIFGLDTRLVDSVIPGEREEAVADPNEKFELMSYCGILLWISDYTYEALYAEINDRFSGTVLSSSPTQAQAAQDYMVVRGRINLENNAVEFLPFGAISSAVVPPGQPPGEYQVRILDLDGTVLQEIFFDPTSHQGREPATEIGRFIIPVLANPAASQAVVLHDGNEIASISASPNRPAVTVVFPNGGESLGGKQTTIEWLAEDPDGDEVTFLVQFSPDGGTTWNTLVTNWPHQSYDVNLGSLRATSNGLVRVMVSDGFHATADISDGAFTVANNPPEVFLISPGEDAQFVGTQSIFFEGQAMDPEDGQLDDAHLQWVSDRDGLLGAGANLSLKATALSEGEHLITLTATDLGGLSATASVRISVFRLAPLVVLIEIDVHPESINCENERQVLPVAILTTESFDARMVDHTTVALEGASEKHVNKKSGAPRRHEGDVDGDGDIDLLFHFRLGDTNLSCGSTEATLVGETFDGQPIQGMNAIHMITPGG